MAITDFGETGRYAPASDAARAGEGARRIPPDILSQLTEEQAERLTRLLAGPAPARHRIAYRVSSSMFGSRFYVALFAGVEKRCPVRVRDAGERRWFVRLALDAALFGWAMLCAVAFVLGFAVVGAYLLKSGLGIDLFEDHFVLHGVFFE
jgi:hypothetical protein